MANILLSRSLVPNLSDKAGVSRNSGVILSLEKASAIAQVGCMTRIGDGS